MRLSLARKRKPACPAFTLIELLFAMVIAAFVFSGFYLCLSEGFAITKVSRENLRAVEILQQQMETIHLYTWDQINSNGFIPATFSAPLAPGAKTTNTPAFTGRISIANPGMTESYASDHKLVTVTLTWTSGGVQRQRQMYTLISKYGMHNYYY
jgi:prepilin-type N-terminal cleavage/methylation domain-containing protein